MPNAGLNPDHGYTTFDNMGWSLIMALQILTKDFWENVYNKVSISIKFFLVEIRRKLKERCAISQTSSDLLQAVSLGNVVKNI